MRQIPESSEDDSSGSEDEWLPEKEALSYSSSSDSEAEEVEDVPPDRAQGQKKAEISGGSKTTSFRGTCLPF